MDIWVDAKPKWRCIFEMLGQVYILPETNSKFTTLKMDGWNTSYDPFLLGPGPFRGANR